MKRHNRYLIYQLLHHQVSFHASAAMGNMEVNGMVDRVARNIFDSTIEITVGGETFSFREPTKVVKSRGEVVFVYGEKGEIADDDKNLWQEVRSSSHFGETVFDVIDRTQGDTIKRVGFQIGPKKRKPRKKKHWTQRASA